MQLGYQTEKKLRNLPSVLTEQENLIGSSISLGSHHSTAIFNDPVRRLSGILYSWGSNTHGQAGLDPKEERVRMKPQPILVFQGINIHKISCGALHTESLCRVTPAAEASGMVIGICLQVERHVNDNNKDLQQSHQGKEWANIRSCFTDVCRSLLLQLCTHRRSMLF